MQRLSMYAETRTLYVHLKTENIDNKKKTNNTTAMYNIILSFLIIIIIIKKYELYILHEMCLRRI